MSGQQLVYEHLTVYKILKDRKLMFCRNHYCGEILTDFDIRKGGLCTSCRRRTDLLTIHCIVCKVKIVHSEKQQSGGRNPLYCDECKKTVRNKIQRKCYKNRLLQTRGPPQQKLCKNPNCIKPTQLREKSYGYQDYCSKECRIFMAKERFYKTTDNFIRDSLQALEKFNAEC